MNGKGDTPRPLSVSRKTFEDNWDLAFGIKQRNVPDPLPLRKLEVPLIDNEIKPIGPIPEYGQSIVERCQKYYHLMKPLQDFAGDEKLDDRHVNDALHPLTIEQVRETPQSIIDEIYDRDI